TGSKGGSRCRSCSRWARRRGCGCCPRPGGSSSGRWRGRRNGEAMTLDDLRRLAVSQTLFAPTTLERAVHALGFVQADPIRAPARAQDLTLRHRVEGYRAGDLERRYDEVGVEEDFFVNYGFVTRSLQTLMHPRPQAHVPVEAGGPWPAARHRRAKR